jgi:hypothetical protein
MLLYIFRAESGAVSRAPRNKASEKRKSREERDGSEDLNGKGSAVAERQPFKPQTVLLRLTGLRGG